MNGTTNIPLCAGSRWEVRRRGMAVSNLAGALLLPLFLLSTSFRVLLLLRLVFVVAATAVVVNINSLLLLLLLLLY